MIDLSVLDNCIETYGQLVRLENMTPQERGQQFNDLIARVLEAHHIPARATQKSKGEIDVTFRVNEKRFILEAKWEQGRINMDPIAKLGLRINQRIPNNMGIVLSMSGFTADTIEQMDQAGRPHVILIQRDIFEAILYGAFDADALFDACVDVAAFEGNYCLNISDVFRYLPRKSYSFSISDTVDDPVSEEVKENLRPQGTFSEFRIIKADLPFGQNGISHDGKAVFLTLSDGVYAYDGKRFVKLHSIDNPQNRCIHDPNSGKIYFVRDGAVLALDKEENLYVVSKRRPGHVRLFGNQSINVISNGSEFSEPPYPVILVRDLIGDNLQITTTYPPNCAIDACFIDQDRFAVIGSAGLRIFESTQQKSSLRVTNGASVSFNAGRLFFLENGVHLKSVDLKGEDLTSIIRFNLGGSVGDFTIFNTNEFYFHLYYQEGRNSKGALVYVKV